MTELRQAVILCGGLGSRMKPLTDTLPKPMAPVNGRPFLAYLIDQLPEQGITHIVLLTGYLGELIRGHFGGGEGYGVTIEYSQGPVEWDTGRRIWEARSLLESRFVLLYSDNFTPFSLEKLVAFHDGNKATISLLAQRKEPGNIRIGDSGWVEEYDPTRQAGGLDCVEIGYMLVERDAMFAVYDQPDVSFSSILRRLSEVRGLAASMCQDGYHSISDPARWKLAELYLARKRILLIDRDGTINQRPPRGEYVTSWAEFKWIKDSIEAMSALAAAGFQFIVISNQAGIARGMMTSETVLAINERMTAELRSQGIEILDIFVCPHAWDEGCECRKPAPGMLLQASRKHLLRLDRTFFIGDDPRDRLAAENAGCASIIIGCEDGSKDNVRVGMSMSCPTLSAALPWIFNLFEKWDASL